MQGLDRAETGLSSRAQRGTHAREYRAGTGGEGEAKRRDAAAAAASTKRSRSARRVRWLVIFARITDRPRSRVVEGTAIPASWRSAASSSLSESSAASSQPSRTKRKQTTERVGRLKIPTPFSRRSRSARYSAREQLASIVRANASVPASFHASQIFSARNPLESSGPKSH